VDYELSKPTGHQARLCRPCSVMKNRPLVANVPTPAASASRGCRVCLRPDEVLVFRPAVATAQFTLLNRKAVEEPVTTSAAQITLAAASLRPSRGM
jgi:hypothetical protein